MKVGIIGTGFGKMIGLNFKAVDPSTKIFFTGLNKEKTKTVAQEVLADGIFETWKELASNPEIDLVVIASPSYLHEEMFKFIAKQNKNILVEKPAATTSKGIEAMNKIKTSKLTVVNHEGRFHPITSYFKDTISSGKLGKVLTVRVGAYSNWYSSPEYKESWNNFKEKGGGQIFSIGTHQIDLARFILGMPKIIAGAVQTTIFQDPRFKQRVTAENQMVAHFQTSDETSIQLFNDCYCFGYKDFVIEVIGSQGILTYSDQRGLKISLSNQSPLEEIPWVDPLPEIKLGNSILTKSMKYMTKALIESVSQKKQNPNFCTLSQAEENLRYFEKFSIRNTI